MQPFLDYDQWFIAPTEENFGPAITKALLPAALWLNKLDVKATVSCLDRLAQLQGTRTVIVPNHADQCDPLSIYALSMLARENFYYIAARELFDKNGGLRGQFMQAAGAYSVIRGEIDTGYVRKTLSLIAKGNRKLVMFAEGDVTGLDNGTTDLTQDGLRILLIAQKRLMREFGFSKGVSVLPISIKYDAQSDVQPGLVTVLDELDGRLGLPRQQLTVDQRIERCLAATIEHLEHRYGIHRYESIKPAAALRRICLTALEPFHPNFVVDEAQALHMVRSRLRKSSRRMKLETTDFGDQMRSELDRRSKQMTPEFERFEQMMILARTLEQPEPYSLNVKWRIVDRLQTLILGHAWAKGNRSVLIDAAAPILLQDYMAEYQKDRQAAVNHLGRDIRRAIESRQSGVAANLMRA